MDDQREPSLHKLLAMPYTEHLETTHWQRVHAQALEWAEHRCA